MNLPAKIYTETDIARARKKGKTIGWIQGAGVVLAAGFLWNLLGWIPTVLVVGAVVYVLYKLLARSSGDTSVDTAIDTDELDLDSFDV